ncbi:MAG: alginate export family protein [Candidatus Hydrogenedentes bacterium]|nr:alginate export family protein [Candidatus Hydrogenedentota bacterium]
MVRLLSVLVLMGMGATAVAELQEVSVGGEVRIRGRHWTNTYNRVTAGPGVVRIPAAFLTGRPLGPFGASSRFDFDDAGSDAGYVEHRTRINLTAKFSDEIRAFVELESFDIWGEDFRSDYVTGADARAATGNDVELYQGYIEADELLGYPVRLRLGRQEMKFGKGWLVDDITTAIIGRSWDAARVTYSGEQFTVDAWWSKLAENTAVEQDGDIDFYGVYGDYKHSDALNASAYWMLVRDARSFGFTQGQSPVDVLEGFLGLDKHENTYLNTVGTRFYGKSSGFDYDWELAYQFGEADAVGFMFRPFGAYGDDDAEFGSLGTDLEAGYTLDMKWSPRVFLGGAFFEGEDNRDISFGEWLFGGEPESSISFNRLFPGKPYSLILGIHQELSNFWQMRGGVSLAPSEKVTAGLNVAYFVSDEPFDRPAFPGLSFLTRETDDELGWTTFLWGKYQYSQDLSFMLVWEHLFTGDGLADGNYFARNGLELVGGTDDQDADYVHFDVRVSF